jgi:ABC-2 type transport system ATP-binding protein
MEEAERLADRIAVIAAGRIVAEGTPQTLGGRQLEAAQITFELPGTMGADELPAMLAERVQNEAGGGFRLPSTTVTSDLHELSGWALDRGVELEGLKVNRPTLEDVYLQLTTEE